MSAAYCRLAPGHPFHGSYHASEYGFPARDDAVLFERLVLEINQAGLSWLTVLKKREAFRAAFASYDIEKVAAFTARDVKRLMNDEGIIRNRLKIEAVIDNAKRHTSHSRKPWLFRCLARCASPADQREMGEAVQTDLPLHRR